jgi:hypothetical protein
MNVGVMEDYKLRDCYIVYYESIKRDPKVRGIYECQRFTLLSHIYEVYYETRNRRLKAKVEEST